MNPKLQQNLGVEFLKNEKALKEIIFVDPWLDSNKEKLNEIDFEEQPNKKYKEFSTGQIKVQVGLFIQYYGIKLFLKSLLVKEVFIFH